MPRRLRIEGPDELYHVTARGVAGTEIYPSSWERALFARVVEDVVSRFGWLCHAYCQMTTHFHLLLTTPEPTLAVGMQRLNSLFAQRFNRRHDRHGHLFQGRYWSGRIESEGRLLETCRYILLNPVRAGICSDPVAWGWSSYRASVGLVPVPAFLHRTWLLQQFADDEREAERRLRVFVAEGIQQPCPRKTPPGVRPRDGPGVDASARALGVVG